MSLSWLKPQFKASFDPCYQRRLAPPGGHTGIRTVTTTVTEGPSFYVLNLTRVDTRTRARSVSRGRAQIFISTPPKMD